MTNAVRDNVVRLRFPPPSAPTRVAGADRSTAAYRHLRRLWMRGARPGAIFVEMAVFGWTADDVNRGLFALFGAAGADGAADAGPVERAAFVLAGGARPDPAAPGGWRVNGVAVRPETVVALANRVLALIGKPPIAYPGAAPCHDKPAGCLADDLSGKGGRA